MDRKNSTKRRTLVRLIGSMLIAALVFGVFPGTVDQASAASAVNPPSGVKATSSTKYKSITIKWKKPAKKTRMMIYVMAGKSKKYKFIGSSYKTSYTLKKLVPGVKYRFKIRANIGKRYSKFVTIKNPVVIKKAAVKKAATTKTTKTTQPTTKPTTSPTSGTTKPVVTDPLMITKNTRIVDLGFVKYVSLSFQKGYNKDNTTIEVDGTVVNDAVTNVTNDGSVAKWELTSLSPAKLTVTEKNNSKNTQTVALSANKTPVKPEVRKDTAPAYILTHGSISTFDYYLPNYDDDGKLRVHPAKTTFDLSDKSTNTAIKCYSPVAELKTTGSGQYGVSGTVELMFNWSTQEEKDWFDGIATSGALQLVRHNESKEIVTGRLQYTKETDVPHGSNRIAEIRIPIGQDNFFSNGRYYVRVNSTKKMNGRKTVLVPVHIVNETKPSLELNHGTEIRSGQNIHFNVKNMAYAIENPIEKVELTGPDGKTKELTFIDDWFLFGDLFVIYNDVERNEGQGVNNTPLNGKYTVSICANGFKDFSKSFKVTGGENAGLTTASFKSAAGYGSSSRSALKVDGVSSASVSTGGDSSSGGGGALSISADLLFDVDLLSNALILDRLGIANTYATAICDRFEKEVIYDAVMDKSGKQCYTFSSYANAVSDAELDEDRYLTFKDFVSSGKGEKSTRNMASRVKEVLEDNLLGDIQEDAGYFGKKAPALIPESDAAKVFEGSDAVFTTDDADYLSSITSIEHRDPSVNEKVNYSVADGKLIIHTAGMSFGEKTLIVKSEGYQKNQVIFIYSKDVEDVTLEMITDSPVAGSDISIKAGTKGDLLKNFHTATLQYEGGAPKTLHNKGEIGTTGNDWYEISQDRLTFTMKGGLFKKPGSYTLIINAQYYDGVRIDFEVGENTVDESTLMDAPAVSGAASVGATLLDSGYYRFSFTAEGADKNEQESIIADYLANIESVRVGDSEYSKSLISLRGPKAWQVGNDPTYGGKYIYLKMTTDGFSTEEDNTVEIESEGYKKQTFIVTKDLQLGMLI